MHVVNNRTRYKSFYHSGDIFRLIALTMSGPFRPCVPSPKFFRKLMCISKNTDAAKSVQRYEHGKKRFYSEIDIVHLLK